jgi:hypothetical protein
VDIKSRVGGAGNTCPGEAGREITKRRILAACGSIITLNHTNEHITTKYYAVMTAHKALRLSSLCTVSARLLLVRHVFSRTLLFSCKCCETLILLPSFLNSHFDGVSTTTCCIPPAVRVGASMNVEGMPCPSTSGTVIHEVRPQ